MPGPVLLPSLRLPLSQFTFIDLFAGIGGFRLGFEQAGGQCVFASEWDFYAQNTYAANFGHVPAGDITALEAGDIPDHDILTAGFPCFAAGTLILTIEGYKPIEAIKAGECVLTHLGRWRRVTATMSRYAEVTRTLKGQAILPTVTTGEHPYYIRTMKRTYPTLDNGRRGVRRVFADPAWLPAQEICPIKGNNRVGWYAGGVLPVETIADPHDASFWWLVGRYLADGWRVRRKDRTDGYASGRVVICCNKTETSQLAAAIERAGFHATRVEERTAVKFHISSVELYRFLEQFGHLAHHKTIPGWCLQLEIAKARALMVGYLSGDGYYDEKHAVYAVTTTSASMALMVAAFAEKIAGVVATIQHDRGSRTRIRQTGNRIVNQRDTYRVRIPACNRSAFVEGQYAWKLIRSNEPSAGTTVYNLSVEEDESYIASGAIVHNCQPFSIAGVSKHNALGREHGFAHATQGTLFFDVARIIAAKRPAAFLLENVKNLRSHDRGRTFKVIMETLRDELGYHVEAAVLDARTLVPQHRERIYIVGFREPVPFKFPDLPDYAPQVRHILEPRVPDKYTLSDGLWTYLQDYAAKHRAKGNGFGYGLVDLDGVARTLSARYYKDGSEILIPQPGKNPRRLTPRECARLMGFPESFKIVVSDMRAYRQFGNSVVVPVVEVLARQIVAALHLVSSG